MKKVSLVVPFYNEEKGVALFFERVDAVISSLSKRYLFEVICVNDGSKDNTLEKLLEIKHGRTDVSVLDFSRNFGKEAALTAGLDFAKGDAVIPIDSDLQHPPETIHEMISKWEDGYEVVLGKRSDRSTDGFLQKVTANAFYDLSRRISHIDIPADVGDFRLMDRKVVDSLQEMRESCRFMKGIFAWVGFKTTIIEYEVKARAQGVSKFNTWKLWNFALEGITSFSTIPLRIWTYIGGIISMVAFFYAAYLIGKTLILGVDTPGFASLMVAILMFSGIQLVGIGILGEYLGRVFVEVKGRPVYILRHVY